jgi:hypothetical protein
MSKVINIRKGILRKKKSEKRVEEEARYDEPMEILDRRDHEYFKVDDIFIDKYARIGGVYVGAVYFTLCRHANKDRMCWPSIRRIAGQWGMSVRMVIKGLEWLVERKIIRVHQEAGKSNIYEILDKRKWGKIWGDRVVGMSKAGRGSLMAFKEMNGMGGGGDAIEGREG